MTTTTTALRSFAPSPEVCGCRCCEYDAALRGHHRAGGTGLPPDLAPYSPSELLHCPRFAELGPPNPSDDEERDLWATYSPEAIAWLRVRVAEGLTELEQAKHSAHCLVSTLTARAWGSAPGIPDREPYVWDEIDAYEVLFDNFAQGGGVPEGWSLRVVVQEIRSFAAFLTERGLIPAELGATLDADFAVWIPRVLECFEDRRWWYRRNGRRVRAG